MWVIFLSLLYNKKNQWFLHVLKTFVEVPYTAAVIKATKICHYGDITVSFLTSQITDYSSVCRAVYLNWHQRKYQRSWLFLNTLGKVHAVLMIRWYDFVICYEYQQPLSALKMHWDMFVCLNCWREKLTLVQITHCCRLDSNVTWIHTDQNPWCAATSPGLSELTHWGLINYLNQRWLIISKV